MARGVTHGRPARPILVNGKWGSRTGLAVGKAEMSLITASGNGASHTEKEYISMRTEINTMVNGKWAVRRGSGSRNSITETPTKANTKLENFMAKAFINQQTEANTKVASNTGSKAAKATGKTRRARASTTAHSHVTRSVALASFTGLLEIDMRANTQTMSDKAMGKCTGQMGLTIKGSGKLVSSTGKERWLSSIMRVMLFSKRGCLRTMSSVVNSPHVRLSSRRDLFT
jgi:hypothetical protein